MESASASWVQAQSHRALKQSLHAHAHSQHKLKDNLGSREVLPRRLQFVKAQKECNARPMVHRLSARAYPQSSQ